MGLPPKSNRFPKSKRQFCLVRGVEATLPVRPKALIEAMDEFLIGTGSQTSQLRGVYALLCEYAHPNIGGSKAFENVVTHDDCTGWTHY